MKEWLKSQYKTLIIVAAVVLTIVIALILFFNIPRLTYRYNEDYKGYIVTKAYGDSKDYKVPASHKGKPVVGVGTRAFFRHDKLEEVVFEAPENIKLIGKLSFSECPRLEKIDISHADLIERNAFSYDKSLKDITISAEHIGASAFYKCEGLVNVILNSGVTTIGSMAFSHTNIEKIEIPETIKEVYIDCFLYADNLKEIVIYGNKNLDEKFISRNEYLSSLGNIVKYL